MRQFLRIGSLVGLVAAIGLLLLAVSPQFRSAEAGPIGAPVYLSGDDSDDGGHCSTAALCGGLMVKALDDTVANSTNGAATTDVAIIGASGQALTAFNNWNTAGHSTAVLTGAAITSATFTDYKVIYIPTDSGDTPGGISGANLALLNARASDIGNAVNTAGVGIMSLTEDGVAGAYGWLPVALTTSATTHTGSATMIPTADMAVLSPGTTSANLTHCCWHNVWTGPAGFFGLKVLAFHDHNGNGVYDHGTDHATIIGGAQVTIQGNIELSPDTATNLEGTTHTVTALAEDASLSPPNDLAPAVGVTVSFEVTAGPNVGQVSDPGECSVNADCTTDANGQVSWTYTGSGGPGTDLIVATFVDQAGVTQFSDTVEKIWEEVARGRFVPHATPTPCGAQGCVPTPTPTTIPRRPRR